MLNPLFQLKYKETYEKQKGHYLAGKEISEFPGVVHCLDFQQMRSAVSQHLLPCDVYSFSGSAVYSLPVTQD